MLNTKNSAKHDNMNNNDANNALISFENNKLHVKNIYYN